MDKQNSQILIYQAGDGQTKIEVKLQDETVWLTQAQMTELFEKDLKTINEHISNVFNEGELDQAATIRNFRIVQKEGDRAVSRDIIHYNLDVIISIGYRVKSLRGTQFRIWATQRLKEYIIKGFTMDDERLKMGGEGTFYFKEWLARIREIRASERNLYDKVKDIFATSIDYNSASEAAKEFYATVQNKFHFAITGQTAAEIVVNRIDGTKENLGLTNWKGQTVTREDAEIAKNYMFERELRRLYLLVEQFLSFAELQIELERPMRMIDWKRKLDDFLKLNELEILRNSGKISRDEMETVVKKELERYLKAQKQLPS
ncbi:virulence RhuM family protein [Candidatus Peregrinibacteria bacterium]|nr:virulence RhuM family protein [Candidatus Peregrinibacteria bacterium]